MLFDSEFRILNSKINFWKQAALNPYTPPSSKFKLHSFNVKLFWDKLSLQEKEECLIISSSSLTNCLFTYIGMLECNYFQLHNEKSSSFFLTNEKSLVFHIHDLAKFTPLFQNQFLVEKTSLLSFITKLAPNQKSQDVEQKGPNMYFNFNLLKKFDEPIIKFKEPLFTDIFKFFEKYVGEFCSGDKIILAKNEYDDFINEALHAHFLCNRFSFEFDLNFVISLAFILFENNILSLYSKLFITNIKPNYELKEEKAVEENMSLVERTNFRKLSLNVSKHMRLKTQILPDKEKDNNLDILLEKEDIQLQNLFTSLQKNKKYKEMNKETPLLFLTNPCDILASPNFSYFYHNFHSEEEKATPTPLPETFIQKKSNNNNNNKNSKTSGGGNYPRNGVRNGYDKRKNMEILFVPKQDVQIV